jgi:hypothetical protein
VKENFMETFFANMDTGFRAILAYQPFTLFGLSLSLPVNLGYCFLGVLIGTLVGVLPGLGPSPRSPCFCPQPMY